MGNCLVFCLYQLVCLRVVYFLCSCLISIILMTATATMTTYSLSSTLMIRWRSECLTMMRGNMCHVSNTRPADQIWLSWPQELLRCTIVSTQCHQVTPEASVSCSQSCGKTAQRLGLWLKQRLQSRLEPRLEQRLGPWPNQPKYLCVFLNSSTVKWNSFACRNSINVR